MADFGSLAFKSQWIWCPTLTPEFHWIRYICRAAALAATVHLQTTALYIDPSNMSCPSTSLPILPLWVFLVSYRRPARRVCFSKLKHAGSVKILWIWGRKISAQTTQLLPRNQTAIISFTVQPSSTCLNMICQRCTHRSRRCTVVDPCLDVKKNAENRKPHFESDRNG